MLTLVLLPGMDGTGILFKRFIEALAPKIDVKVVRYPAQPIGYDGLETFARDMLPRNGPFVIVAESFSGPVAVSLAASCSSRLVGLVLCCTFVRNPYPLLKPFHLLAEHIPVDKVPIRLLSYMLMGGESTAELCSSLRFSLAQVSSATLRERLHAVLTVDVSAKFASIQAPVLYVRALHDRVVPGTTADLLLQLLPSMKIAEIAGPHFLLQTAPAEAARAIEAFIQEIR